MNIKKLSQIADTQQSPDLDLLQGQLTSMFARLHINMNNWSVQARVRDNNWSVTLYPTVGSMSSKISIEYDPWIHGKDSPIHLSSCCSMGNFDPLRDTTQVAYYETYGLICHYAKDLIPSLKRLMEDYIPSNQEDNQ